MKKRKILAFTSIRSDYDLMSNLYSLLNNDKDIDLKLLVSGAHMSETYGKSVELIEKDGFDILLKIETLIDSNSKQSRVKTASILLQNSIDIISQFNPDLIIYAGDREDVMIAAIIGGYLQIPTVHFFGGDHVIDGHIDNPIRHATSKLSSGHLVSLEQHKQRMIKMGENPDRIFVIGSISIDKFAKHKAASKKEIKKKFNITEGFDEFAIVIFHPINSEMGQSHIYFENILKTLKKKRINAFVSYPNTDPGNRNIIEVTKKYSADPNFVFYKNLDRDTFLSVYKNSMLQVGNSSAGIVESASVPLPVVNVGLRQVGRLSSGNVIYCNTGLKEIEGAISMALSKEFLKKVKNTVNIYGDGKSSERAYEILKKTDFSAMLLKTEDPLTL
jgi:UDP-hydrolysing UDP-N-acetyl-D-glucosamine 2-epimerase